MDNQALAEVHSIYVVDQNQNPVINAVIIAPGPSPAEALSEIAIVDQIDRQFVPEVSVISMGQKVLFPNSDNIRHHVYSFSEAKTFEIKLYAKRPEAPIPFDQPGIVILGCNIHDQMVGYIIVSASQNWAQTNNQGSAQLNIVAGTNELKIWHQQGNWGATNFQTIPWQGGLETTKLQIQLTEPAPEQPSSTSPFNRFNRYGH